MLICCMDGWARAVCVLDNLNHLLPEPLRNRRLCDVHSRYYIAGMELAEADMTEAEFDARMAAGEPVGSPDTP